MEKYILALDLGLGTTGATVFSNDAKIIESSSICTKSKKLHQNKLEMIADFLLDLKNKYDFEKVIIENGFSRFNKSTQAIYKVHGITQYLFCRIPQILYPPLKAKKIVCGNGHAKKDEVRNFIERQYSVSFNNYDESDSCSIGLCYFISEGTIK